MKTLNRLFCVAAIFSVAFAVHGNAAEGTIYQDSATYLQNRDAAKTNTIFQAFSHTTDIDVWLTYGDSPRTGSPHVRVNYANLGTKFSYSRAYVVIFTSANNTLLIFDHETGILAPNSPDSKVFVIPKDFIDNGSMVEVVLLGSDENPSNDYDSMLLPSTPGI